ncbi:MAG: EexN family lipoprotein [Gallionella sp.]
MKKSITIATVISISLCISACGEQVKSTEYYLSHRDEVPQKLQECSEKAGVINCDAAREANNKMKAEAFEQIWKEQGAREAAALKRALQ